MIAIFKYDYTHYDGYNPNTVNIGDYIQSIAASQYFKEIHTYIDRDSISSITESINIIGNGWYYINKDRHTIPDNVNLLPVAVHVNNRSPEVVQVMKSFAKGGEIGCRDIETMEYLKEHGINCYFSSCLTTTLTREFLGISSVTERSGIIFSDFDISHPVPFYKLKFFPLSKIWMQKNSFHRAVLKVLSKYMNEHIEAVSHEYPLSLSHDQRFDVAKKLLKKYATAKLVITSRIHCALPCLGLGTPVVLITETFDSLRYRGLANFFNHIWITPDGSVDCNIETDKGEIVNTDTFKLYAEQLRNRCTDFARG